MKDPRGAFAEELKTRHERLEHLAKHGEEEAFVRAHYTLGYILSPLGIVIGIVAYPNPIGIALAVLGAVLGVFVIYTASDMRRARREAVGGAEK